MLTIKKTTLSSAIVVAALAVSALPAVRAYRMSLADGMTVRS